MYSGKVHDSQRESRKEEGKEEEKEEEEEVWWRWYRI